MQMVELPRPKQHTGRCIHHITHSEHTPLIYHNKKTDRREYPSVGLSLCY